MKYVITKEDAIKRVYFIINMAQNLRKKNKNTMSSSLTSKSDSMGGIFDRYINSLAEDVIFENLIFPEIRSDKKLTTIKDYYIYDPKTGVGIAPDVFGLEVDGVKIPFVKLEDKWTAIDGMPQIEVKTFKSKDQMISLRNQDYEKDYLIMTDLNLRIDYLVPFLDKSLFVDSIANDMQMEDNLFIDNNKKGCKKVSKIIPIDFSESDLAEIEVLSITNGSVFMREANDCGPGIGPRRMKSFKKRRGNIKESLGERLNKYAQKSPRIEELFEFKKNWYKKTNVNPKDTLCLDFSANKINKIEIVEITKSSIVLMALANGCEFNGNPMIKGKQYVVKFDTLSRKGKTKNEHFMQKECAKYLTSHKEELMKKLTDIIK